MFKDLKRLGRETAVYGLSTIVGRMLNILLLPLYTHALAPADYGVVATLFSYIAFLNILYWHGMDFSFMRYYDAKSPRPTFSTSFWSLAATTVALTGLLTLFSNQAAAAGGLAGYGELVRYAAWIMAMDALAIIPFAYLRMNHRAYAFAGIKVANIALNLALNYVFLIRWRLGVSGVFLASLLTSCATFAMLAPVLVLELRPVFEKALYGELLAFALPLVPAGLASMMVQVIDRPILKFMTTAAVVGIYQANYRLAIFMQLVVNMFDAAWRPFFLEKGGEPGEPVLGRVLTYFSAGGAFMLVFVSLFIPHIVCLPLFAGRSLIPSAYWPGLAIVPIVTLGYLFNGVYINFLAPVTLAKKTSRVAVATAVGAAVNVGTNLWWIPRWGMFGAGLATLAAYAAMAAALYLLGRKIHRVDYEWGRLLHLAVCLAAVAAGARALGLGMTPDRALLRAGLLFAFPAALIATGFLRGDELDAVRRRVGALIG